jgi:large subunit ribosomal protein L11
VEKKKVDEFKLVIPAGGAKPAPPVGPALGQRGLNIMDFCKKFNDASKDKERGMPLPVQIHVFADKSFELEIKTPPASYLLKKAASIEKGASTTGRTEHVATVSRKQVEEIAKTKMQDMKLDNLESAAKSIGGTARSMGIKVSG